MLKSPICQVTLDKNSFISAAFAFCSLIFIVIDMKIKHIFLVVFFFRLFSCCLT